MLCLKHHAVWPVNSQKQCVHAKGGGLFRCLHGPLGKAVLRIGSCAKLYGIAFYLAIGRFGAGKAGIHSMGQKKPQHTAAQHQKHKPGGKPYQNSRCTRGAPLAFSVCGQTCRLLSAPACSGNGRRRFFVCLYYSILGNQTVSQKGCCCKKYSKCGIMCPLSEPERKRRGSLVEQMPHP